jgi:hypothetical protein
MTYEELDKRHRELLRVAWMLRKHHHAYHRSRSNADKVLIARYGGQLDKLLKDEKERYETKQSELFNSGKQ